uniref:DUF4596 domain-containing protein n=1 Tax=Macrostomum lignano TaxID=282301 RepID=A0A1I8FJI7_9PLAT
CECRARLGASRLPSPASSAPPGPHVSPCQPRRPLRGSRQPGPSATAGAWLHRGNILAEDVDECSIEASATSDLAPLAAELRTFRLPGVLGSEPAAGDGGRWHSRTGLKHGGDSPSPEPSAIIARCLALMRRGRCGQRAPPWQKLGGSKQQQLRNDDGAVLTIGSRFDGCQQMTITRHPTCTLRSWATPRRRLWRWSTLASGETRIVPQREAGLRAAPSPGALAATPTYACLREATPGLAASVSGGGVGGRASCCSLASTSSAAAAAAAAAARPAASGRNTPTRCLTPTAASQRRHPKDASGSAGRSQHSGWASVTTAAAGRRRGAAERPVDEQGFHWDTSDWHGAAGTRRCRTAGNPQQPDLLQDNPFYCHSGCSFSELAPPPERRRMQQGPPTKSTTLKKLTSRQSASEVAARSAGGV